MTIVHPDSAMYTAAHGGTVFTRFGRGVIHGAGADRLDLLHRLSTNATRELGAGNETTTILTSDKGRVVEVVRLLALEDHVLLLLSGNDVERVRAWLDKYTIMDDFTTEDATSRYALAGVYGDHAKALLERTFGVVIPDAGSFCRVNVGGGELCIMRDARLTGAGGFQLVMPAELYGDVAAKLAGAGLVEIDEPTYETLRVEAGLPAIGHELSDAYNPLEAGLSQYISWTKGCYIGQEVIARLDTYDKVQRHLVGFEFGGTLDDASGDGLDVIDAEEGKKIGTVTTVVFSPKRGQAIGLGYVRTSFAVPGAQVRVVAAGDGMQPVGNAVLTKLPFAI